MAFAWTEFVATMRARERVKLVRRPKKAAALMELVEPSHFIWIRTTNAPMPHAMAMACASLTTAFHAARGRNVCLAVAPTDIAVVRGVRKRAALVQSRKPAGRTMGNVWRFRREPIQTTNARTVIAMARARVRRLRINRMAAFAPPGHNARLDFARMEFVATGHVRGRVKRARQSKKEAVRMVRAGLSRQIQIPMGNV